MLYEMCDTVEMHVFTSKLPSGVIKGLGRKTAHVFANLVTRKTTTLFVHSALRITWGLKVAVVFINSKDISDRKLCDRRM